MVRVRKLGGYKATLEDNEIQYWEEAIKEIEDCKTYADFRIAMEQHKDLITFTPDDVLDQRMYEIWIDHQNNKQSEERFWDIANEEICNCHDVNHFVKTMMKHKDLITSVPVDEDRDTWIEDSLREGWDNKWSKYQHEAIEEGREYDYDY
jgi:hypothetical protein